jgi:aspartate 1-decarboxylase
MKLTLLKAKIHRATVTRAHLDYEGSVTVDRTLLLAAGILPYERVEIYNVTRGTRLATYALRGPRGSRVICVNGAAAHHVKPGDLAIIATFGDMTDEEARSHKPRVVFVDKNNAMVGLDTERPGPAMPRHIDEMPN